MTKSGLGNLIPYTKGIAGNPKGRPKTKPISDALKKFLAMTEEKFEEYKKKNLKKLTKAQLLAIDLLEDATDGRDTVKTNAIKVILDRVEYKVRPSEEETEALGTQTQVLVLQGGGTKILNENKGAPPILVPEFSTPLLEEENKS